MLFQGIQGPRKRPQPVSPWEACKRPQRNATYLAWLGSKGMTVLTTTVGSRQPGCASKQDQVFCRAQGEREDRDRVIVIGSFWRCQPCVSGSNWALHKRRFVVVVVRPCVAAAAITAG